MSGSDEEIYAVADFCLIPMGTGEPSVGPYIAECHRVLEKSGLTFKVRGYGTNLEGPWDAVCAAIGDCHLAVHKQGAPRIATDIRIGTRTDKVLAPGTGNESKLRRVQEILAADKKE
ncbi:MTH1187/YkoF-like protein [Dacryopinax primogenitus]|uniref:MTH1187/YkoF-like protein n=1 Tax=Dacryopinax primogenitus (strain DJM 731) TaxID=1858805 RepID=M5GAB0_DACPD|nr:MTH1187/YkoF-like protein [Dacryopinax primogenitus]EJU05270.1 MTH1187/YkoF-like protein [Dacryopinax primogenitus]